MAWILFSSALALIAALSFFLREWLWRRMIRDRKLPPGPTGWPVFGSLHLLGKLPHQDLHQLAEKYGPIMYMRLGLVPTVVVSSPRAAESILKTHDLVFANRPPNEAAKYISYEQKNVSFAPYGSYWRKVRKMCTLELLSNHKINSFMSTRKEELALLIGSIKDASRERAAVDLSAKVSSLSADISCRMVFGKKYMEKEFDEKGFKPVIHEAMRLAASFNLGDYIPPIAPLDLQGLTKRMKAVGKVFDDFFVGNLSGNEIGNDCGIDSSMEMLPNSSSGVDSNVELMPVLSSEGMLPNSEEMLPIGRNELQQSTHIIDEHIEFKDETRTRDFVDVMLDFLGSEETEYRIGRDNIKAIMLARWYTSATAIEWTLSELMKHPRVMKKVQKELEEKIGMDRMVEESDLEGLEWGIQHMNIPLEEEINKEEEASNDSKEEDLGIQASEEEVVETPPEEDEDNNL
ncbi:hypothetical protein DKX38_011504 [Salix brachista]|uniref:Cytochrome P450 n=1 Tax=Salix brachista TaxID=2182728 RepID=A0A5N5LZI6_9ROSI|nr:hypothetical protein DKX38_011504 [Salix brachista]